MASGTAARACGGSAREERNVLYPFAKRRDLNLYDVEPKQEIVPELPLHASTQMTITSADGVLYAASLGFLPGRACPGALLR
jgi:hypothetical protein